MTTRIAVVGGGYWGKNLIRNFHELGCLSLICDSNGTLQGEYNKKYPGVGFTPRFEEVISNTDVDAVVLATPAAEHYAMAKRALLAGKHVFVEKPLALKVEEASELVALSEKHSLILMVGHILQYHNAVLRLKELIDSGELGKLQYIYSNRLNIGKIRTEENILWSFAPHDISVILMLLHEMPEAVFASGGNYLQEKISDTSLTIMNFSSGVKAHIFVSWLHPFKEQKLVVVGDRKMAVFDDTVENKLVLYPHKVEWRERVPVAAKADAETVPIQMTEPLKAECQHFLECIDQGKTPKTDGKEGLRVLQILNVCQESLDKGGAVIELNNINKAPVQDKPPYFVHESSYVDEDVEIGEGTRIWNFSHVLKGSRIGKKCSIGQNVVIGPKVTIGNGCKIQNNVSVFEGLTLEDDVFCGPSIVFTNVFNPRSEIPRMMELRQTLVRKGASLGANCTIVCGNTVGSYSFVGAGSVVTHDVPDYALVVGNPATITGWVCRCGVKLNFKNDEAICESCGSRYLKKNEKLVVRMNA